MIERICKKCGKIFIPAPQHIFVDENGIYCTWTCYNHREKPRDRYCKKVAQYTRKGEYMRTFPSAKQAAEEMGGTTNSIRIACNKQTPYLGYFWQYKEG